MKRTTTERGYGWTLDRRASIGFVDGAPEITGLAHDLIVTHDGAGYMARHHINAAVRFHHLLADDPKRDLHDHPWDFISLLLTGGYREWTTDGAVEHWAPTVVCRRAEDPHRLELLDGPMWTLISCGPFRRRWGFHTAAGWVHWSDYPGAGHYADVDRRATGALT